MSFNDVLKTGHYYSHLTDHDLKAEKKDEAEEEKEKLDN